MPIKSVLLGGSGTWKSSRLDFLVMDGYAVLDLSGNFLQTNDTIAEITGYSRQELTSLAISDLEVQENPDQVAKHISLIIQKKTDRFESQWRKKDGTIIDVEVSVGYFDSKLIFSIRDISKRKMEHTMLRSLVSERTDALLRSNQELLVANARLAQTEFRLSSVLQLREISHGMSEEEIVQYWMDRAIELTGSGIWHVRFVSENWELWELFSGMSQVTESFHPSIWKRIACDWKGFIVNGLHEKENFFYGESNEQNLPRFMIVPVIEKGQARMLISVVGKIAPYTELELRDLQAFWGALWSIIIRNRKEQELQRAKQLAEVGNRIKTEFLANVGHELRTPLNAVLWMAQLLWRKIDRNEPMSPKELAYKVGVITSSGNHLLRILDAILNISQLETEQTPWDVQAFDLQGTIFEITFPFRQIFQEKNISFFTDISVDGKFLGDRARISQVLENLLDNAAKFTKEGGAVELEIRIDSEDADTTTIRFSVKDTGIGIPQESLSWIFQKFHQVDGSLTRAYGGVGLGLAISKRLVERMGGAIGVSSKEGEGSTFWFTIKTPKNPK